MQHEIDDVGLNDAKNPPTLTGGFSVQPNLQLEALVDWFSVTFLAANSPEKIADILGLKVDDFCKLDYGNRTYRRSMILGHIRIFYEGATVENGVFLEMTGQGCREYEALGLKNWRELMFDCLACEWSVNFPRLDIAIDQIAYKDAKPYFTVPELVRKAKRAELVSRATKGREMADIDLVTGEVQGTTLYVGSVKSNMQLRFYEKHHERTANKVQVEKDVSYWLRSELQLRDDHAKNAVCAIINEESLDNIVLGALNKFVSFRVKDTSDSNRSRWPVWRPWERFLNNSRKISLAMRPVEPTIYQKRYYMEKQFSRTMAILFLAFGNDFDQFVQMIDRGMTNLKETDLHEIKRFVEMEQLPMTVKTFDEFTQKIESDEKIRRLIGANPNHIVQQLRLF